MKDNSDKIKETNLEEVKETNLENETPSEEKKSKFEFLKNLKIFDLKYNQRKVLWGLVFIAPWLIGFIFLFVVPFVQSFYYSFFDLKPIVGGIEKTWVGFGNYIYAINEHVVANTNSSFKIELLDTLKDALLNLPVLLIFSLFIAVLLNHEFRGRAFVRAIFFIPVILNSSAVTIALGQGGTITDLLLQESAVGVFDLNQYLMNMGIGTELVAFIVSLIGRIYDILTLSGVPILLFLAAIQSVPNHLYEAATIEGATGYEMFWLITLPNVSPHIITVSIYAIVDTFLTSSVSTVITGEFNLQHWGLSSAMSWIYVASIILLLIIFFAVTKIMGIGASHYEQD